jgi:hypothetical protein
MTCPSLPCLFGEHYASAKSPLNHCQSKPALADLLSINGRKVKRKRSGTQQTSTLVIVNPFLIDFLHFGVSGTKLDQSAQPPGPDRGSIWGKDERFANTNNALKVQPTCCQNVIGESGSSR